MAANDENSYEESALNAPIPFFHQIRKLIFGDESPTLMMKISIYINFLIWVIFFIWHIMSFYAISSRDVILQEKKINVEILIFNRGSELGFDPSVFLENLLAFHRLSIIFWAIIFLGNVLMWRMKKQFAYFLFGSVILYYLTMLFYLGIHYYMDDTTPFDKISIFVFLLNSLFFVFMLRNHREGKEDGFFTEE